MVRFRNFKCPFDQAKGTFYRSRNAVFGRIGRVHASEEVFLQLVTIATAIPVLQYGVETMSPWAPAGFFARGQQARTQDFCSEEADSLASPSFPNLRPSFFTPPFPSSFSSFLYLHFLPTYLYISLSSLAPKPLASPLTGVQRYNAGKNLGIADARG